MKDEQIYHKQKAWLVLTEQEELKIHGQWELRSEELKYWLMCWRVSVNVGVSVVKLNLVFLSC